MARLALVVVLALVLSACGGGDDDSSGTPTTSDRPSSSAATSTAAPTAAITAAPSRPAIPQTEEASDITLPDGFAAYEIANGFATPTSVGVGEDGAIYVSETDGTILRLIDEDSDGVFESSTMFFEAPSSVTGILVADKAVYVSSTGELLLATDTDGDGVSDQAEQIVTDLPTGRHQNNGVAMGPDGKLYMTNGSDCDDCVEENERSASILQANADGSDVRVYASGLRNPYDITFDAQGQLWATDNGSDEPCATVDELNLVVDGGDYGWPYGEDGCDNFNDGIAPAASLGLHTASTGIAAYDADVFPEAYRGLFMSIWGNFFEPVELSPRVMHATVDDSGGATVETFAEGFAHPIDVFTDADGSLLVLDYGSGESDGALYRIVYTG